MKGAGSVQEIDQQILYQYAHPFEYDVSDMVTGKWGAKGAVKVHQIIKITRGQFNDVMAHLAWVSEDTLRKGRRLDREELLEYTRKILDMAGIDYTTIAGM